MRFHRPILTCLVPLVAAFAGGCSGGPSGPSDSDGSVESNGMLEGVKRSRDGSLSKYDEVMVPPTQQQLDGVAGPAGLAPNNDTCPGNTITLDMGVGSTVTEIVSESTSEATDDYSSFCGDKTPAADAPDVAYTLVLEQAGTLELSIVGAGDFQPVINLQRHACGANQALDQCLLASQPLKGNFAAGTYWVIVDGNNGTSGDFTLTAKLSTASCGDGVVNPGEECDDANLNSGDGCDACGFEAPTGNGDTCPGDSATIGMNETQWLNGNTTGYTNDAHGSCVGDDGSPDHVFKVTPSANGTLNLQLGRDSNGNEICVLDDMDRQCWDRALYVRKANCGSTNVADEVACSDGWDWSDVEEVSFAVTANTEYFVFVDGYASDSYGYFELEMNLVP